jgi:hypothetical protein
MTEQATSAPAAVSDTPSREPLSISQAAALLDRQDATATKATPAPAIPEQKTAPDDASTDTADEAPVDEAGEVEQEQSDEAEAEPEPEDTDDDEDPLVALPDGREVKLSEMAKGYLRRDDYSRKTAAVAEDRKALEQHRQQVVDTARQIEEAWTARFAQLEADQKATAEARDGYSRQIEAIEAALNQRDAEWSRVNWQAMQQKISVARQNGDQFAAAEASAEYMDLRAQYDMYLQGKRAAEEQKQKTQAERDAEAAQRKEWETAAQQAKREKAIADVQGHAVRTYAEFQDPIKGKKLADDMLQTAHKFGFSKEEVEATTDPRNFDLWYWATRGLSQSGVANSVTQQTAQTTPKAPPSVRIVKGAAPRPRPSTVERGRLGGIANAFAQSGSFEDALRYENAKTEYARRQR